MLYFITQLLPKLGFKTNTKSSSNSSVSASPERKPTTPSQQQTQAIARPIGTQQSSSSAMLQLGKSVPRDITNSVLVDEPTEGNPLATSYKSSKNKPKGEVEIEAALEDVIEEEEDEEEFHEVADVDQFEIEEVEEKPKEETKPAKGKKKVSFSDTVEVQNIVRDCLGSKSTVQIINVADGKVVVNDKKTKKSSKVNNVKKPNTTMANMKKQDEIKEHPRAQTITLVADAAVLFTQPLPVRQKIMSKILAHIPCRQLFQLRILHSSIRDEAEAIIRKTYLPKMQIFITLNPFEILSKTNHATLTLDFSHLSLSSPSKDIAFFRDHDPVPKYRLNAQRKRERIPDWWTALYTSIYTMNEATIKEFVNADTEPGSPSPIFNAKTNTKYIDVGKYITVHKSLVHSTSDTALHINFATREIKLNWKALFGVMWTRTEVAEARRAKRNLPSLQITSMRRVFSYAKIGPDGKKILTAPGSIPKGRDIMKKVGWKCRVDRLPEL